MMHAVVLAGGKGTRLAPYTNVLPKPLMPIGNMPILEVLLRQMKVAGFDEVTLTVGHLAELLEAFFKDGSRFGMHIRYSIEDSPLGTAGPLALVGDLTETFLVCNGDVLTTLDIREVLKFHKAQGGIATVAMHQRQVKVNLGVIQLGDRNEIMGYLEKPSLDYLVSMGIYMFEPEILKYIEPNQYLDFPDLILKVLAAKEKVYGYLFDGYWQDLGNPEDYQQAQQDFAEMQSQFLGDD
jgi:NDP-sugar pyrophosphorylase family protein